MSGYTGKILRVNLTDRTISVLGTKTYEEWGGGHGMGSAIFWDLCEDKTISGFDPRNVVTIMTSPLTGTLAPGASGRTEIQGIGTQSYPIEWFTRSNFGGRFGAMLKYAGWDGVVIEGKATSPVWIDVRNEDVQIRDADPLWGKDTWQTQKEIWQEVSGRNEYEGWVAVGSMGGESTQRPAVLTIGPAGENLCRVACLIHDAGHASGQGGFGAVWGAKLLKAISVIGTGSVSVADPSALIEARQWSKKFHPIPLEESPWARRVNNMSRRQMPILGVRRAAGEPGVPNLLWRQPSESRPQACIGCPAACRSRYAMDHGNEAACLATMFYTPFDLKRHNGKIVRTVAGLLERLGEKRASFSVDLRRGKQNSAYAATDLLQKLGSAALLPEEKGGP